MDSLEGKVERVQVIINLKGEIERVQVIIKRVGFKEESVEKINLEEVCQVQGTIKKVFPDSVVIAYRFEGCDFFPKIPMQYFKDSGLGLDKGKKFIAKVNSYGEPICFLPLNSVQEGKMEYTASS